jgi:NAD(P)-dependent dehydrogenase (short-subunit alcohol dehydrogenase family)
MDLPTRETLLKKEGVDLTSRSGLDTLASAAKGFFDAPFGLVHSVGKFWDHKTIVHCDVEDAREIIETHYLTLYGVLNRVLPLMTRLGGGRIIAFSCTSVGFHYPEMAPFTSAKAAVECLVRCVANEWADQRITANAIALSTIATPKVMESKPLAQEENYVTPDEVSTLVQELLFSSSTIMSGNVVRPLKHSETFYNRAYFERNPRGIASPAKP